MYVSCMYRACIWHVSLGVSLVSPLYSRYMQDTCTSRYNDTSVVKIRFKYVWVCQVDLRPTLAILGNVSYHIVNSSTLSVRQSKHQMYTKKDSRLRRQVLSHDLTDSSVWSPGFSKRCIIFRVVPHTRRVCVELCPHINPLSIFSILFRLSLLRAVRTVPPYE
jgi:hypothetical protein